MKIILHSGTALAQVRNVQRLLERNRDRILERGILHLRGTGSAQDFGNLMLAALPPGEGHPWAELMGVGHPIDQREHALRSRENLGKIIAKQRPQTLILSAPEAMLWLNSPEHIGHLKDFLADYSPVVRVVLHMAHPAEALLDLLIMQVLAGRTCDLSYEKQAGASAQGWGEAAAQIAQEHPGAQGLLPPPQVQLPPGAVDGAHTAKMWGEVFGEDLLAREFPPSQEAGAKADPAAHAPSMAEVWADLGVPFTAGNLSPTPPKRPSAKALARMMQLNRAMADLEAEGGTIPQHLRLQSLQPLWDETRPLSQRHFGSITKGLRPLPKPLSLPSLAPDVRYDPAPAIASLKRDLQMWHKALKASRPIRERRVIQADSPSLEGAAPSASVKTDLLTPAGERLLDKEAHKAIQELAGTRLWPGLFRLTSFDEEAERPPFDAAPAPPTGALIITCMKNEGPYILEWIAYHHAIGIDHFLVFTNDCTDGTVEILTRLEQMGLVTHIDNSNWKGSSPQHAALRRALKTPQVQSARWLIHIDVDEYINSRIGQGTMGELFTAMGDATNLAMTWRLFGNNQIDEIGDASIIERFTACSPAYCPKPHTLWGFKSITRNIGAYEQLGAHRPKDLREELVDQVKWLNGSLKDVTSELLHNGWRCSLNSIGFEAVQLNHYALRSRESFLIKRQRGRALHIAHSIGLGYWMRHDWNEMQDRTILRQIPRMAAQKARFLADKELAALHKKALHWHLKKASELRKNADFKTLWEETFDTRLSDSERVGYSMAARIKSGDSGAPSNDAD